MIFPGNGGSEGHVIFQSDQHGSPGRIGNTDGVRVALGIHLNSMVVSSRMDRDEYV